MRFIQFDYHKRIGLSGLSRKERTAHKQHIHCKRLREKSTRLRHGNVKKLLSNDQVLFTI